MRSSLPFGMALRLSGTVVLCGLLAGCIAIPAQPDDPSYAPVYVPTVLPTPASTGGLYSTGSALSLYDDRRALRVGDIITVVLEERFQSSKRSDSSMSKTGEASIDQPTVLGSVLSRIATTAGVTTSLGSSNEFEGSADAGQSNNLSGTLSVTVTEVMPNGAMVVRGEKWLTLNQGEEFVRLSGLVRAQDVSPDNTVSSRRLANARIAYSGKGAFADASSMGWLTRFFASPLFPF